MLHEVINKVLSEDIGNLQWHKAEQSFFVHRYENEIKVFSFSFPGVWNGVRESHHGASANTLRWPGYSDIGMNAVLTKNAAFPCSSAEGTGSLTSFLHVCCSLRDSRVPSISQSVSIFHNCRRKAASIISYLALV